MSDDGRLGVVVAGTGFGCLTHVRAIRAAGHDVIALVGRDPEKTADRAARFGVTAACTSLAEALALPRTDAVTVATPPHTHAPLVLEAVAAGRHVVCEKPFAADAAEGRSMLDAAERAGVVHLLGTEFRWAPGQALMARLVHEGAIGRPRLATFLLHIPLLADPSAEVPDWWSDRARGGGWLGAHASHVVDQVRTTLGEIAGVAAVLTVPDDRPWTAEDGYSIQFRTTDGAAGVLQSTAADRGPITAMSRVIGSTATVWTEGDVVKLGDATGTRTVEMPEDLTVAPPEPPPGDLLVTAYDLLHSTGLDMGPYTRLYEVFGDLVRGAAPPHDPRPATFADGVANMAVIDAVRRAAADGGWVAVSDAT